MKKALKKVKNVIIWILFYINLFSFLFSVCCLDSDYYLIFGLVALFNLAFMFLFYIANFDKINRYINAHAK